MVQASQIREHMNVVGSDGGHVGRVDHVVGEEIELAKLDFGSGFKPPPDPDKLGRDDRRRRGAPEPHQGGRQVAVAREALSPQALPP